LPLAVCDDKRGQNHQLVNCGAVVGVAAVAAVASYEHAYDLVRLHGEAGWTARLVPLTVDGLIYASSMVMLDSARRETPVPALARWLLSLGIAATLAANVAHGRVVEHGNDVTSSQASNASSGPASAQDVVAGCVTDGRVLAAAHAWWPDEVAGASLW
jgi:hypothetical protein